MNSREGYTSVSMTARDNVVPRATRTNRRTLRVALGGIIRGKEKEDFLANYNCLPPPLFIPFISIVEIAVFIYYAHGNMGAIQGVNAANNTLAYVPSKRYEAWRFLTYIFIHFGYLHILANVILQLLFGVPLEIVHKWWRVGMIYLIGSLAGSLFHSVVEPNVVMIGASGGVYAIIGAHLAAIITNWKEMNYKCLEANDNCPGMLRILCSAPARLAVHLSFVLAEMSLSIYSRYAGSQKVKVALSVHIGGFLAGILLGVPILRNVSSLSWERRFAHCTTYTFIALVVFCILYNIFYDGYRHD